MKGGFVYKNKSRRRGRGKKISTKKRGVSLKRTKSLRRSNSSRK